MELLEVILKLRLFQVWQLLKLKQCVYVLIYNGKNQKVSKFYNSTKIYLLYKIFLLKLSNYPLIHCV
jgi:hypothetical protein